MDYLIPSSVFYTAGYYQYVKSISVAMLISITFVKYNCHLAHIVTSKTWRSSPRLFLQQKQKWYYCLLLCLILASVILALFEQMSVLACRFMLILEEDIRSPKWWDNWDLMVHKH